LILGWWVGVHWRCKLKFLLDCLYLLVAWRRVVLCLLAIRQPSWWSRKEPHWYSHGSFISDGLGMTSCAHDFMRHYWQTTINWWHLLIWGCMSWHLIVLVFAADMRIDVFEDDGSRHQIGWYEVSCTLLLISLLAWVPKWLNARLPSTLFMSCWFICPLSMSKSSIVDPFCGICLIFFFVPKLKL
jgi:hypothetical protein